MVSFTVTRGRLYLGKLLRFPDIQLTGPLFIAAISTVSGITTIALPEIILIVSQIVIGASLGSRFAGLEGKMLVKAMVLSLLSVCAMLTMGITLSPSLMHLSETTLDVLLISFSPGVLLKWLLFR